MDIESCVPPGFRFHPTEEELVGYYLKKKINSLKIDLDVIVDIDLYNIEPWEIQDRCIIMGHEEQNEWYFFSHKDKKYPTGTRTNRATAAGFWKATGRDKAVLSKNRNIIGMRKTLVFYKGRAPNGRRSDWIMHEYRLQTSQNAPPQEEGWVVCRAFKKPSPNQRQGFEPWNHVCYNVRPGHDNHVAPRYLSTIVSPMHAADNDQLNQDSGFPQQIFGSFDQDLGSNLINNDQAVGVGLPELGSPPSLSTSCLMMSDESYGHSVGMFNEVIIKRDGTAQGCSHNHITNSGGQYVDWKKLDELLAVAAQPGGGDAATTSFSHANLELYEIDAHSHNAGPSPRTLS